MGGSTRDGVAAIGRQVGRDGVFQLLGLSWWVTEGAKRRKHSLKGRAYHTQATLQRVIQLTVSFPARLPNNDVYGFHLL
jgi:hypothetical protein